MPNPARLAIISDIHYAGHNEQSRAHEALQGVDSLLILLFLKFYRRFIWLRDPFAHNHLLDQFIRQTTGADCVVANGDYSCNVAYVGVTDDGACQSTRICLDKLRQGFGPKFFATFGDHELGKKKMGGDAGGLRLTSWHRACQDLALQPFWQTDLGRYRLIGLVSTLLALPLYETEADPSERPQWHSLRSTHVALLEDAFRSLAPNQKVILFCHDPTALPYLYQIDTVRNKLPQIERTVIGHLHSNLILRQSQLLSRIPQLNFGHTSRRITSALRQFKFWKPFNILLCPAPFGIELLKDGGYYTADLDPDARQPAQFNFHPFPR